MLEEIALSVSTFFFIVCNLIINSLAPAVPAETAPPSEAVLEEPALAVSADADEFSLVGQWESCGFDYEFTSSGKLISGDTVMHWALDGDTVTVTKEDGRIYEMALEPLDERVMRLGGVTMYKVG
ncbi:MAG: hypothetical protein IJ493_09455 [Clostridia bacterium]|nr:hypothetical protein [Clostridia bacterium]